MQRKKGTKKEKRNGGSRPYPHWPRPLSHPTGPLRTQPKPEGPPFLPGSSNRGFVWGHGGSPPFFMEKKEKTLFAAAPRVFAPAR